MRSATVVSQTSIAPRPPHPTAKLLSSAVSLSQPRKARWRCTAPVVSSSSSSSCDPLEVLKMNAASTGLHQTCWSLVAGIERWRRARFRTPSVVVCAAAPSADSRPRPAAQDGTRRKSSHQPYQGVMANANNHPQNADLPRYYSKREKKPFPVPVLELRRAARQRLKSARGKPKRPTPPPRNGMLVRSLIPLAYDVLNARILLMNNLKRLMKVVPAKACKHCNEIHVGSTGHPFKSCRGMRADHRKGLHDWTTATLEDVFVPIESYHLFDRLGRRITHEERYSIPRVPAIVELCVQAGVDLPDLPTKRRRKPVIRIRKSEIIDANEDDLPDPKPDKFKKSILEEIPDSELAPPATADEIAALAEATLEAWETLRQGAERLMKKYAVRVCGYCPEVHVGPSGHKAQNCGAFKHQQRNGQHGWQAAVLDDLIPPRYVWHVPEGNSGLQLELRNFYGQAPAVVELCVQGGAKIPEHYKPTMRLDVGIPTNLREAEMVV